MRSVWVIARRELRVLLASRAFQFGTAIGVLTILALSFMPSLLVRWTSGAGETAVVVSDQTGQALAAMEAVRDQLPEIMRPRVTLVPAAQHGTLFGEERAPSLERLRQAVLDGDVGVFLHIDRDESDELRFVVGGKDVGRTVSAGVQQLATPVATADRARRWGIEPQRLAALQAPARMHVEQVVAPEASASQSPLAAGGAAEPGQDMSFWLAYLLMFMLYMSLILYGQMVANGIASEKGNRVVEMVLVAARPADLLRGKLAGVSLGSLVQYVAWGAAAAAAFLFQRVGLQAQIEQWVGFPVEFSAVPLWLLGYLLLFFLLGFISYGALYAASASLASRPEEANQTVWPALILIVIAYVVAAVGVALPEHQIVVLGSMLPFIGPMAMFTRLAMTQVPAVQIVGSVAISLVAAWLTLKLAERVYRGSVLLTRRVSWAGALRQGSAIQ